MGLNNLPKQLINRILDTNGDGTGSTNQAVDGSVTPVTFKLAPAAGEVILVSRISLLEKSSRLIRRIRV